MAVGTVGIRSRRARATLTAVGIAIGIAAMVAVLGISASSRADLLAKLDRLGTNLLEVTPGQSFLGESATLPDEAPGRIRHIAPVESAASITGVSQAVHKNDRMPSGVTGGLTVAAVEPQLATTVGAQVHAGRFLDGATAEYPTVVLGAKAAAYLGISSLAEGPQVLIGDRWFTVIGILDPVELVPSLDHAALIGYPAAFDAFGTEKAATTIYVRTNPASVDDVRAVLPASANPQHANEVKVNRPSDALAARAATNDAFTALLLGLGGVALLVGGVGIANVMVISVLERRTEIGVRRALGASRRHVLLQFLLEATLLAGVGGTVGVVGGAAITAGYSSRQSWTVSVPVEALAAGVGAALAIGVLAGIYPAARAARLAPAAALRTPT